MLNNIFNRKPSFFIRGLVVVFVACCISLPVWAVGGDEAVIIVGLIRGPVGTIIGLCGALLGLWMFLMSRSPWGIIVIMLSMIFTFFPDVFGALYEGFDPFLNAVTGEGVTNAAMPW